MSSFREFKKRHKLKYYLGEDSVGNKLYAADEVELSMPIETRTPWKSRIHWNPIDGAFVDAHPAHKQMGIGNDRGLRQILQNGKVVKTKQFYNR